MSRKNQWRWIAALVAPMLGTSLCSSHATAGDGRTCCPSNCDDYFLAAPYQFPSAESMMIEGPTGAPPETDSYDLLGSPESETTPLPEFTEPITQPDFDLSAGLATNFGAGGARSLAFADVPVAPGYIESAVIQSRVRLRYDNAQGANAATRAGFLYPTPGSISLEVEGGRGPFLYNGSNSNRFLSDVDLEESTAYIEVAFKDCFSLFIDIPYRSVFVPNPGNPSDMDFPNGYTGNLDENGFGDLRVGLRLGLIVARDEHLTLQVRTWVPTGDARRAIGTGNTSIDVGVLYDQTISDNVTVYAELNDWQTLDAVTLTDAANVDSLTSLLNQDGNILRYGAGVGLKLYEWDNGFRRRKLTFLAECVGWTVLNGVTTPPSGFEDATGDTIVNGKYGCRLSCRKNSIYVGYGHNWTSDRWYSDLLRLEYQRVF